MNDRSINRIILFSSILTFAAILAIAITNGTAMYSLLWNGKSVGIFPDLFESIRDASERKPYEGNSIYPAFAYLVCWILSQFTPGDKINWESYSLSANGNIVGFFFFMLCTMTLIMLGCKLLKQYNCRAIMLLLLFLFSPGYIYCIERGNMVILSTIFLLAFVGWYDSDNKYEREIALVSLALAAAMKIYPAVFGVLLLFQKKWKDAIKTVIYGIIAFVFPFVMFGGIQSIVTMVKNITYLSVETISDTRNFGYGYKINIKNIILAVCQWFRVNESVRKYACTSGIIVIILCIIIILWKSNEKWQRIWGLTLVLTLLPSFSWLYNSVYFIIPMLIYLKEHKATKFDVLYDVCFTFLIAPLPYGYIMESLPGVNKMSISTISIFSASILMSLLLVMQVLYSSKSRDLYYHESMLV